VVFDASGDRPDTWSTLGGAMALASADAGVEIDLDPTTMVRGGRDLAPGQVVHPWAHGAFTRPDSTVSEGDGSPGQPNGQRADREASAAGEIWVCKLGWWTGAPWGVLAYAKDHPTYPSDGTLKQLYDAAEFDAYQQLAVATVRDASEHSKLPLTWASP
jgi:hypothetical protein